MVPESVMAHGNRASAGTLNSMIELVPHDEMVRREHLADAVRSSLAAAGLGVVVPGMFLHLGGSGAEVTADPLADCHAPVRVSWRTDHVLEEAFRQAMNVGDEEPAARHYLLVIERMLPVMTDILMSDGLTVRDSTNDFAPFSIEVLLTSQWTPSWYDRQGS
ncbi:hypothetical protein [Actinoplanes sp. NPDC051494]|uniref:hypothetical protein n=1 Tax=Actinoplanes sp. NPDC051494 TaxID=3363907 RepID=UPI003789921F